MKTVFLSLLCCLLLGFSSFRPSTWPPKELVDSPKDEFIVSPKPDNSKIRGISLTAPPKPYPENPMPLIAAVNAEWIAVIPYGFTRKGSTSVSFNSKGQWWGEREEGIIETVQCAHKTSLKVMLKPQIWVNRGGWIGFLDFDTEAEWKAWEVDYEKFIMRLASIAEFMNVEMLCIGTEIRVSVKERPEFWKELIRKVRGVYPGKLTYAANWDDFEDVSFWKDLDYVGINAYFPLVPDKTPSHETLVAGWAKPLQQISKFHKKVQVPIIFTEFGYLSVDGCAYKTWEIEPKMRELPLNEQAQANALHAIFDVFWEKEWWAGGFLWKWFPNPEYQGNLYDWNYTCQGKIAEDVLKSWYGRKE